MNDDVIGTKAIAQQIPEQLSQAIAQEKLDRGGKRRIRQTTRKKEK